MTGIKKCLLAGIALSFTACTQPFLALQDKYASPWITQPQGVIDVQRQYSFRFVDKYRISHRWLSGFNVSTCEYGTTVVPAGTFPDYVYTQVAYIDPSLPLDGRGRLGGDVVGDAVDAAHLVDDAVGDLGEQLVRQRRPLGGHEVGTLHRAQGDDVLVGATVAHHADRFHRQEHREGLRSLVVPVRASQFLDEDRIGLAQKIGVCPVHLAEDAHAQAGARERMADHHLARQAERQAEFAYLVLEQLAQRLEKPEVQRLGQAADVVVRLDGGGLLGLRAGRLDDVRIDRALGKPARVLDFLRLLLKDIHEQLADDLALFLRIGDAAQRGEEPRRGVDVHQLHVPVLGKGPLHLRRLVQAQQAVVDEHASELPADGAVDQRRRDR